MRRARARARAHTHAHARMDQVYRHVETRHAGKKGTAQDRIEGTGKASFSLILLSYC